MIYTKEKFKELWDSNDEGGGITFEDIADCAIAWGLFSKPKINPIDKVQRAVLNAANCDSSYMDERELTLPYKP